MWRFFAGPVYGSEQSKAVFKLEDPGSISMVTSVGQVAEEKSYQEAFDSFDWNKNGTIPVKVSKQKKIPKKITHNTFVLLTTLTAGRK